jgi:hypothetical protein
LMRPSRLSLANEHLVTRSDFNFPGTNNIKRIGAAQIECHFFLEGRTTTTFFFSTRTTVAEEAGRLRAGAKVTICPGS